MLHRDSELSDLLPNTVIKKNLRIKIEKSTRNYMLYIKLWLYPVWLH